MNKPNFNDASDRLVPSELRVTASEDAEEKANADLESDSEEKDIEDFIRPIEQSEQWHDEYISRSSGEGDHRRGPRRKPNREPHSSGEESSEFEDAK